MNVLVHFVIAFGHTGLDLNYNHNYVSPITTHHATVPFDP